MRISLVAVAVAAGLFGAGETFPAKARDPALEEFVRSSSVCGPDEGNARRSAFGRLISGAAAWAQAPAAPADAPPLISNLGDAHLDITTTSEIAQDYFDQGLRMLHGFNHAEAARAFRYAQTLDPGCAMCFWGEAFALGPNINAPMAEADNAAAYTAARKALDLSAGSSPVERALIEATAVRYSRDWPAERAPFDLAFANAMSAAASRFPENDVVQVISAEADMDTQPWDYWDAGGRTPKGRIGGAIEKVEAVLARNPGNAAAIHLYIHLVEASTNPWRAEDAAAKLDKVAANAGHLVHMPAHIYYRVGRFQDSINLNIRAAEVDEAYIKSANASPTYQYGYYTHNLHFVLTSAQMGGDARNVIRYADKLDAALPMSMARDVPIAQPIKAAPWFARADYADPEDVLAMPAPEGGVDFVTASWRYARSLAHLRAGHLAESRSESAELSKLSETGDFAALDSTGAPSAQLLEIYMRVLEGKQLMAEKRHAEAIRTLDAAASIQAGVPYMEPPFVYYPTGRTLGAAYVAAGRHAEAEQVFLGVLVANPNDALAYWGIAEARKRKGDKAGERGAFALFENAWLGAKKKVTLATL